MSDYGFDRLATYLRTAMEERSIGSGRAFARYLDLPRMTVARMLNGERVDPETLVQVAGALDVPVEMLYRLCGYLPPAEDQSLVFREVEALLRNLDRDTQRHIRDLVREEVDRLKSSDQPEQSDISQKRAG
ncbi:MAG: helix-turn-helix transcriptional regulator [Anaerolineae bacterium]|nr:helix-turn-helix transcriptional regulator [Anaerolineae bacterium]